MGRHQTVNALELHMIDLEYAICDLRFAQEDLEGDVDCQVMLQACAQVSTARQALDGATKLLAQAIVRREVRYAI